MRAFLATLALLVGCASPHYSVAPASCRGTSDDRERVALYREIAVPSVRIETAGGGCGSGIVIYQDSKKALVLTAAHVVLDENGEVEKFAVMRNHEDHDRPTVVDGKAVRVNPHLDLALVQTAPVWREVGKLVRWSDLGKFGLFSKVAVYGHSLGLDDAILTEGRITDLDDHGFMGISAPITFGNSGCGVWCQLDGAWTLVGVVQRGYVDHNGSSITFLGLSCRPDTLLKFLRGIE